MIGYIINEGNATESESVIVAGTGDRVIAEGILQDLGVKNRNGRIYEEKDIAPEIMGKRMTELINAKQFKGEANHPIEKDVARQQVIYIPNTCVQYTKVWKEGNLIKAQFKGTNNALGEEFNKDLLEGAKPAFSLRALGTLDNKGGQCYVRNIKIITYDHVIYPSHEKAYTSKLVTESASVQENAVNSLRNRKAYTTNENGLVIPVTNEKVIDYIKTESANVKSIRESLDMVFESYSVIDGGTAIQMSTGTGTTVIANIEDYIYNEISSYCEK